jgi:hypothetical protein
MTARRGLVALAALGALAGCGTGSRTPGSARLPLVPGSAVVVKVRECNRGANSFCAVEMVVQGAHYASPKQLLFDERVYLQQRGWKPASPDTGVELADESPGDKLRVTYATALQDLKGIDLGWIARPPSITSALDRAVFDRVPTMSVLLEVGSQ